MCFTGVFLVISWRVGGAGVRVTLSNLILEGAKTLRVAVVKMFCNRKMRNMDIECNII
jgi:hypothetical protein